MAQAEQEASLQPRVVRVLLDSRLPQLDHLFEYEVPPSLRDQIRPGQRVSVPFRSATRTMHGWVIECSQRQSYAGKLAPIKEIMSPVPLLNGEVYRLARAIADRAGAGAGSVLKTAIPKRFVRTEQNFLKDEPSFASSVYVEEEPEAQREAAHTGESALFTLAQMESVSQGEDEEESVAECQSVEIPTHFSSENAEEAVREEKSADSTQAELPTVHRAKPACDQLSEEERDLLEIISAGKWVSYQQSHGLLRAPSGQWVGRWADRIARWACALHASGSSVIVCVPDYRDIDQVLNSFYGVDVLRLDTEQTPATRYQEFLHALEAKPRIIVGNRTALLAPAYNLGAILMWDDGDSAYEDRQYPYVHARDIALLRSKISACGLAFFAHFRTLEMQRLVELGYAHTERVPQQRVRIRHADQSAIPELFTGRIPSAVLALIREGLRTGSVLVQVAQPGYAPGALCRDCFEPARCPECGVNLKAIEQKQLRCIRCEKEITTFTCTNCSGINLAYTQGGNLRTAEQLQRLLPEARILISDANHPRQQIDARKTLVVSTIGAEPLAVQGYRVVVLLDAYRLLARPTLFAEENCLRWWENAAALAAEDGVCMLGAGEGQAVQAFLYGRLDEWRKNRLRIRAGLGYPPMKRSFVIEGAKHIAEELLEYLHEYESLQIVQRELMHDGNTRIVASFSYTEGAQLARDVRAFLVAKGAGRGQKTARSFVSKPVLKIAFDYRKAFEYGNKGEFLEEEEM